MARRWGEIVYPFYRSTRPLFRRARYGIVAALAGFLAAPALALDVGECGSIEEMSAKLKAEGQHSLVFAATKAGETGADANVRGVIFSANESGAVGYTLHMNRPCEFMPTDMCVYNRMADVRIYDVRKPGLPPEVRSKASDAESTRTCKELLASGQTKECRVLNGILERSEAVGKRVLMQGRHVKKDATGVYKPTGIVVTITANVDQGGDRQTKGVGAIHHSTADGAAGGEYWVFIETKYSEAGEKLLKVKDRR